MIYLVLMRNAFKRKMIYRSQIVLELFTNGIIYFTTICLWTSVLNSGADLAGYDKNQLSIYFLFTIFSGMLFSFEPCFTLGNAIQNGSLSVTLLRPVNYFFMDYARQLGSKLFYILLLVPLILLKAKYPLSLIVYILSAFSMFYAFMAVLSLVGFILENTWPLRPVLSALFMLLSGQLFPLDILPEGIYKILVFNPFSLVGYVFSKTLIGSFELEAIFLYSCINGVYFLLFFIFFQHGFRKLLYRYEGVRA